MNLDKDIAIESFVRRYNKHSKEEKIDNSKLYAGSPMYFYCRGCTCHVATLPECYISPPPRYCDSCKVLVDHGILNLALEQAKQKGLFGMKEIRYTCNLCKDTINGATV